MYNFVFFVVYSYNIQNGKSENYSKYQGGMFAAAGILFFINFVLAAIRKISSFESGKRMHSYHIPISSIYLIAFGAIFIIVRYYTRDNRTKSILEKFSTEENPTSTLNYVKVAAIIILPFIGMIALLQ
ncbi:MAG: hypothetical protein JST87_03930 [Bacteroidetes bacterium]|nr:hypothetical protein [Bacteroidota bacterium]